MLATIVTFAAAIHTLATSSNTAALVKACSTLQPALWESIPAGSQPKHTPDGDAAMRALSHFLIGQGNPKARISCLRFVRNLSTSVYSGDIKTKSASAYVADVSLTLRRMLRDDPSPAMRVAAAQAMWGSAYPDDGVALLQSAGHDSSPAVRAAAFRNMMWPARADIKRTNDLASYDAAIGAALKSPDAQIVGGALIAQASLHGLAADAATRPFAFDRRPLVRESAIDAYGYMQSVNVSEECFIESRLNDPDPNVRGSVMQRLFEVGDHAAVPAIEKLAAGAPTADERKEAAEYVRAFKTQPEVLPHASCSTIKS